MNASIKYLATLIHSFPLFDRIIRSTFSEVEEPAVASWLRDVLRTGRASVLAVDLGNQEVIIGYMEEESPASRTMIAGKVVVIPR
jgi:hypothetical protein